MLKSANIAQIATTAPTVYAFRIKGGVTKEEIASMAEVMNAAFERDEIVDMLLIFHEFEMSDATSGVSLRSIESQFRSLKHVRRYAVVGAPAFAATMIETFEKIMPIEAETFDPGEEAAAWSFVGAEPA